MEWVELRKEREITYILFALVLDHKEDKELLYIPIEGWGEVWTEKKN